MQSVMKQALEALVYLHDERDIIHRDIKPENVLLKSKSPTVHIKLCDFGLSKLPECTMSFCGTRQYVAPEVATYQYNKSVDIWALGVLGCQFLRGLPAEPPYEPGKLTPHWMKSWAEILRQNLGQSEFEKGPEVNLLKRMLHKSPHRRPSAKACLLDPWFQDPLLSSQAGREEINVETLSATSEEPTVILGPPKEDIPGTDIPGVLQKRTRPSETTTCTKQSEMGVKDNLPDKKFKSSMRGNEVNGNNGASILSQEISFHSAWSLQRPDPDAIHAFAKPARFSDENRSQRDKKKGVSDRANVARLQRAQIRYARGIS